MWWQDLTLFGKIFFCIAVPTTIIMVVQIILLLVGLGADADMDGAGDISDTALDGDIGLSIFTTRGLIAFFAVGGWTGYALTGVLNDWLALLIALAVGTAVLFLVAIFMKKIAQWQSSGNLNFKGAVGEIAEVYLTIPANNAGSGKINLTLQERLIEAEAITYSKDKIPTGSKVKIVDVIGTTYIVDNFNKQEE